MVGPVLPFEPGAEELDELAFADDVRKTAPNEHLWWLRGQYVEADEPNLNGQLWTTKTLEIASLTPMLMPITVNHDPRTAVGLIADAKLLQRGEGGAPRARIDTTLALWKHRFPEVVDEAAANYRAGTLMQSQECRISGYDCVECGQRFPKLPGGAERANWCTHLQAGETSAATTRAARRLVGVCFTGTGLLLGSRGIRGALDTAHLEVEELAEFHEQAKAQEKPKPRRRRVEDVTISRSEYDDLKAKAHRVDELGSRVSDLEESASKIPELERRVETEETAKTKAETERDNLKQKVDQAEEQSRRDRLGTDRRDQLGKGFLDKLGEFTRGRLEEQAGTLSDEEWDNRLKELEEISGVKRADGASDNEGGDGGDGETFTREETSRSQVGTGRGSGASREPSSEQRRAVVAGLVRRPK